jgi:hypothetical protein
VTTFSVKFLCVPNAKRVPNAKHHLAASMYSLRCSIRKSLSFLILTSCNKNDKYFKISSTSHFLLLIYIGKNNTQHGCTVSQLCWQCCVQALRLMSVIWCYMIGWADFVVALLDHGTVCVIVLMLIQNLL